MRPLHVIGGANVDIIGAGFEQLREKDSNPGMIRVSFGGVACNIARNLALYKEHVSFCSVFSEDAYGRELRKVLQEEGVDLRWSKISPTGTSSMYLAILDDTNDMQVALSDMRILDELDDETLVKFLGSVSQEDYILADTNLQKSTIDLILETTQGKVVCDPISCIKARKIKDCLNRFTVLKPNRYEAEELVDCAIQDKASMRRCLERFIHAGVEEIVISLSDEGVIFSDGQEFGWMHHDPLEIENATGGGDAFLAGYLHQRNGGATMKEATAFACGAAVGTILVRDTVNPNTNEESVRKIMETIHIHAEEL